MSDPEDFVFTGAGGSLTSDEFVRAIRRRALRNGMQDDDRLMAQTAASHIGGAVLLWFEDLSEEVQDSWKLLRRALLMRWPVEGQASSSKLPTPAAAPQAHTTPPPARGGLFPEARRIEDIVAEMRTQPKIPRQYAKADYSFTRSTSDEREVDLVDGEIVEVIDARGTWWKIVRWNGEAGIAPSTHLTHSIECTRAKPAPPESKIFKYHPPVPPRKVFFE